MTRVGISGGALLALVALGSTGTLLLLAGRQGPTDAPRGEPRDLGGPATPTPNLSSTPADPRRTGAVTPLDAGSIPLAVPTESERRALAALIASLQERTDETGIRELAHLLNQSPGLVMDVAELLLDDSKPLQFRQALCASLGMSQVPQAHDAVINILVQPDHPGRLRHTAAMALGQQRGDGPKGPFLIASGDVVFGFPIRNEALLQKVVRVYREELKDTEDEQRSLVRGKLAYVLSANTDRPEVVDALSGRLDVADDLELAHVLTALSTAPPDLMSSGHLASVERILLETNDGNQLGPAAAILMKAKGARAILGLLAAFQPWLSASDRDTRAELSVAISEVSSYMKSRPDLRAACLQFFSLLLVEDSPHRPVDEATRQILYGLARFLDGDLASAEAERVLGLFGNADFDWKVKKTMVVAIPPARLSRSGATRLMATILRSASPAGASAMPMIVALVSTCTSVPEDELVAWAERLDEICGGTLGLGDRARQVRQAVSERHR